jgi:N-acetylmuramoyl-L-alanine amidase
VNATRHPATLCLLALATLASLAQTTAPEITRQIITLPPAPAPVPFNKSVIFLDPAHGGLDSGSRIGDSTLEKDVDLAFAFKLRSLLSARGFTVVMTRDSDAPTEPNAAATPLTLDDRAGIGNHTHAVACLLLHATGTGNGVHLYGSELDATDGIPATVPWLTAQAAWVSQSQTLKHQLGSAITRAGIALVSSNASVRPVDSLSCPALVIELAPQTDDPDSINFADYQQSVAQAIAAALVFWPNNAAPPQRLTSLTPAGAQP